MNQLSIFDQIKPGDLVVHCNYHGNLIVKKIDSQVATCYKIDEPKIQLWKVDENGERIWDYPVIICAIENIKKVP